MESKPTLKLPTLPRLQERCSKSHLAEGVKTVVVDPILGEVNSPPILGTYLSGLNRMFTGANRDLDFDPWPGQLSLVAFSRDFPIAISV